MFVYKSVSLYTKYTFLLYIIVLFILVLDLIRHQSIKKTWQWIEVKMSLNNSSLDLRVRLGVISGIDWSQSDVQYKDE